MSTLDSQTPNRFLIPCVQSVSGYIYIYIYLGSTPLSFTERWFINVHFKEKEAIHPHTFPMEIPHAFSRLESLMALRPRVVTLEGEVIAPNGNMSSLEALVGMMGRWWACFWCLELGAFSGECKNVYDIVYIISSFRYSSFIDHLIDIT